MPKEQGRRRFLQKGAALAGLVVAPAGAVLGSPAAAPSALPLAQGDGTVDDVNSTEAVLYGRRSPYANTLRKLEGSMNPDSAHAASEPDAPGRQDSAWRADGHHHAVLAALHHAALLRHPDHRSGLAPADDPRARRAAARLFGRRAEAAAVRVADLFHRVHRQPSEPARANRRRYARPRGLQRMDRRAALGAASTRPDSRPARNGFSRRAPTGGSTARASRCRRRSTTASWRTRRTARPVRPDQGFPLRLVVPGMEGIYQVKWLRRIKVVDQPYLTFQEIVALPARRPEDAARQLRVRTEVGDHLSVGLAAAERPRHLQHLRSRVVGRRRRPQGGSLHRRRQDVQGSADRGSGASESVHALLFPWNWDGEEAVIQSRCIDEKDQMQPSEEEFAKYWGWTRQQMYQASNTTMGHCNWIQAWKINRSGDVTNGLPPVAITITDMHEDHR